MCIAIRLWRWYRLSELWKTGSFAGVDNYLRQQTSACLLVMLWTVPPPARESMKVGVVEAPRFGGANMQAVTTIGLDIAKSVFQVHGIDAEGPSDYPQPR
jgi:hypothetical protein